MIFNTSEELQIFNAFNEKRKFHSFDEIAFLCKVNKKALNSLFESKTKPTTKTYFKIIFGIGLKLRVTGSEEVFTSYESLAKYVFTKLTKKQVYAYFVQKLKKRINPEQYNGLASGEYSLSYERFAGILKAYGLEITISDVSE